MCLWLILNLFFSFNKLSCPVLINCFTSFTSTKSAVAITEIINIPTNCVPSYGSNTNFNFTITTSTSTKSYVSYSAAVSFSSIITSSRHTIITFGSDIVTNAMARTSECYTVPSESAIPIISQFNSNAGKIASHIISVAAINDVTTVNDITCFSTSTDLISLPTR